MKLAVEVLDAGDLMPKDTQGSASPFVEVDFADQRHRTTTKLKDLNPSWNETLLFHVPDSSLLPSQTITLSVYHDRSAAPVAGDGGAAHHRNFLGRVRISGASVASSMSESTVQRYPLDKRGLFSHIRGDIALRLYVVPDSYVASSAAAAAVHPPSAAIPIIYPEVINPPPTMKKPIIKEPARVFYSVGTAPPHPRPPMAAVAAAPPPGVVVPPPIPGTGGAGVFRQQPEYGLVETSPPVAGRLGYRHTREVRDKVASTYDLVEQMQYLYVSVVKARDLPGKDLTGGVDPFVEVKLGNYKGVTKHHEKNHNPEWHQAFAFSRERLQASLLEVVVKDRDLIKDDVVGRVVIDLSDVPVRVPPDSPLAPQWYRLEGPDGEKDKNRGEVMLAVWMGTQADEAFPESWHSDAHDLGADAGLVETHAKVYFSPKLCYLRVQVIEAQDLIPPAERPHPTAGSGVRVQLGHQLRRTRPSPTSRSLNPIWSEEFMFVAAEPFDELLIVTVDDGGEPVGRVVIPLSAARQRPENGKPVESRWFSLARPTDEIVGDKEASASKFSSKIHLRLCLDSGYHVLDESTHHSSDLRPTSKQLRKPGIGILELGILSARNLAPMKTAAGRATDAYCVAKYGTKWVRTRTLINTLTPRWNEQYTWEVFDPCTVVSIAVFDNAHISSNGGGGGAPDTARDQRIGKIRIRLSTLEVDRVYTHYYPLLVLQPSGLKKTGELHLAVRFTCTAWANMLALYGKPLLPKMHYVDPIPIFQVDYLRRQATQIVAARLARSEPPLRREVVEYLLDTDTHMWSMRRSKANFYRIISVFSGVAAVSKWFDNVRNWTNPATTVLVHILFLILVCYPELILPTFFLYLFLIGVWNYRYRLRQPAYMDTKMSHAELAQPEELDEEFDTFPTTRPPEVVRMRYDRLRSVAGRVQAVVGDLATQGERATALLSWRDPRATAIFILFAVLWAVVLYVTPFQMVAVLVGLYVLRHPKFRTNHMPSVPFNFYRRLPSKSDMLL